MSPQAAHDHAAAHASSGIGTSAWLWLLLLGLLAGCYLFGVCSPKQRQPWPWQRTLLWTAGLLAAAAGLVGPMARDAAGDFRAHMLSHLLIGMLAPLLLVLGAPVTLLLRALPVPAAKRVTRLLSSPPLRIVAHPVTALLLNSGGLWLLYLTGLAGAMHRPGIGAFLIAVHLLAAGYLFTAAIIGIDPVRHRPPVAHRAVVLVVAMAAHAILAKWLYAHPPAGFPIEQAEAGARLMYYGGDAVDLLLITIFCAQWYRRTRPRPMPVPVAASPTEAGA